MDPLYIVELDVTGAEGHPPPSDIFERLFTHVVSWLGHDVPESLEMETFRASGQTSLPARRAGRDYFRHIRWASAGTDRVRSFVCTLRQDLDQAVGAQFVCTVTIFHDDEFAALRIEMGKETVSGLLTPAPVMALRRPGILRVVQSDRSLRCTSSEQLIDGRFQWINPPQANALLEAIDHLKRLPLLLVDGTESAAEAFAGDAARELGGLAQVFAVDARSLNILGNEFETRDCAVPPGGARLVWPAVGIRHPDFSALQVEKRMQTVGTLMRLVGAVSVAARGQNRFPRLANEAARTVREETFAKTLADFRAAGDSSSEVATLTARVDELTGEVSNWVEEVERLSDENQDLRAASSTTEYWKATALAAQAASQSPGGLTWDDAPELLASDLDHLADFLTGQAADAIVFTHAARRNWKQSGFRNIDTMRDSLTTLSQAAVEWRTLGCKLNMHADAWFKIKWELTMASTDKGLVAAGLHEFEFEDQLHVREPHLKLGDHTSPDQVGRVYFAWDTTNKRIVVDHVGVKLYGL